MFIYYRWSSSIVPATTTFWGRNRVDEQYCSDTNGLIRLHHLVGVDEDDKWSRPVNINLSNLFADFNLNSVTETTLTANKGISYLLSYMCTGTNIIVIVVLMQHDVSRDVMVTLNAKDIRTFIVQLVPK